MIEAGQGPIQLPVIRMTMHNGTLTTVRHAGFRIRDDYFKFVNGYETGRRITPAQIAWLLETEAVAAGWSVGRSVGSEPALMDRFGVSRDTLREAVRLLESRGSMVMERGRRGGLHLVEPDLECVARAFSMYLRAHGWSHLHAARLVESANPVLAMLRPDNLILQLFSRTLELLSAPETLAPRVKLLGMRIATRLIQHHSPIPAEGIRLGSEDALCERIGCSRATFRQALRILDDLGALQVQRGRGGGYLLKPPLSIGIVRQMFGLFASRQFDLKDLLAAKWALDLVRMRLAMQTLTGADVHLRERHLVALSAALHDAPEPYRWCRLQREIGLLAPNPMIAALLWCLVAYDLRIGAPELAWNRIDAELGSIESRVVSAMAAGSTPDAEFEMRRAQDLMSSLRQSTLNPCSPWRARRA